LILSLIVGLAGILGFGIHTYFLRRGHDEFNTLVSRGILWAMLVTSVAQLMVTLSVMLS
jgi:hypothetical protein